MNKTYDYISYFQVFKVINTRDIKSVLYRYLPKTRSYKLYAVKKLFVRVILYKFVFPVYQLNHLCQKKGGQFRETLFSVDFNTFLFRTKCLLIIFKTRNIRIMMKTNFKILFCGRKRGGGWECLKCQTH